MLNWYHPQNVLLTCRKESESCFVCLGCESSYYSMHGLHYHLNRTRYMKNKQGVEGKSPPKSCKKSTTFFRHFFILNGIYMCFLFCFETFHLFNWPSPMPVPKRKINCSQPELLAHNILYLMFGWQWFLLLELKIIFLQNNISFKVRIRWTGKNSKQKKLQRSLCEVRETFIEKICTVYLERNGYWNTVVRHTGNLFMCLGPGCGYTIGYLTGMHR